MKPILLGAHFSIAGGLHAAIDRALELECTVLQLFTHNPRQWAFSPVKEDDPRLFQEKRGSLIITAHSSYLINLASGDGDVRAKSLRLLTQELERAEVFGVPYLVLHPGSCGEVDESAGLKVFASALDIALTESENIVTKVLLETTAGHKSSIGQKFEHLRDIISLSTFSDKLGVCFDTCHAFAAGYDLRDDESYNRTMDEFDKVIGLDRLLFFHLNDSKKDLGTHADRHEHIGEGCIGTEGFRLIMEDERFTEIGKCIETPKGDDNRWDKKNLSLLRDFAKRR
ncbi:MAG: deoxyribonuclease IV [Spirochaetales bacterium]|nr:deoxyribonuclease IV [Spirochaetales bacterium]